MSGPQHTPLVELTVGTVAHGGHCVAHLDGRVVFVRHALPGERVLARLTDAATDARFWRADAVEVLDASPDRVPARCPAAGPGGCGGCDWQHVDRSAERRLKADVVAEQMRRLAGLPFDEADVVVESVTGDVDGLGWRTRTRLAVGPDGRAGLRRARSHDVVPLDDCPLAHPDLDLPAVLAKRWSAGADVLVTGGDGSPPTVQVVQGRAVVRSDGPTRRYEQAAGRRWRVTGAGFWQVHPGAADALVRAVDEALQPRSGESLLDLYSGVGLFAGALAEALGPGGSGVAVESDASALADARRNLHDLPQVRLVGERVELFLASPRAPGRADLVVLDPPRTGAGGTVVSLVARRRPRSVAYVACDPAALARDVRTFVDHGYRLTRLRAFDIFPRTHHVECVATLQPTGGSGRMVADVEETA